jgi:hypothetical protein
MAKPMNNWAMPVIFGTEINIAYLQIVYEKSLYVSNYKYRDGAKLCNYIQKI